MRAEAPTSTRAESRGTARPAWFRSLFGFGVLVIALTNATAAPPLTTDSALGFFTNAAGALLQKQNLRDNTGGLITATNIPIWPLNYYTPAVHRLLQVAANIFECTTTNLYPCIYRPLFSQAATGTNIYISGFELVNGPDNLPTPPSFISQIPVDVNNPVVQAAIAVAPAQSQRNLYGVPWIIGAKKGFPNLNQIAMQSVSQMTRKLLVYRPLTRSGWTDYHGKQMFVIGISNSLAVEIWNSYNTAYPRPLYVQADCKLTVHITNDVGYAPPPVTFNLGGAVGGATNLPAGSLLNTGMRPPITFPSKQPNVKSFVVPLQTNVIVLPDSVQIGGAMFVADNSTALWNALPWDNLTDPHWGLNITNNLRCIVMDGGSSGRVVDYVQLSRLDRVRDLTGETLGLANRLDVWNTNANTATLYWATPGSMSQGVLKQIQISSGSIPTSDQDWAANGLPTANKASLIANFSAFLVSATVSSNVIQAPFTPTSKIRQMVKWQANDPLVHYLTEDLNYLDGVTNAIVQPPNSSTIPKVTDSMYRLNDRFSPWGGFGPKTGWDLYNGEDEHIFDTALKDPLVMVSDHWNFPSNQPLNFSWLGQVHRGTPWQTIYLKSADILSTDLSAWMKWTGSANAFIATNLAPISDWPLATLLIALLDTNRQQISINDPGTNAWLGVLDGFVVLTNDPAQAQLYSAILSSNSPQAGIILNGINQNRLAQPGGYFHHVSDILAVPELTDASPCLVTNYVDGGGTQLGLPSIFAGGITDEALEKIPAQLLPRLRLDSVGSLISTNGPLVVKFTGDDNYFYAIEASTNLVDWWRLSTNEPVNEVFSFDVGSPVSVRQLFFRSRRLP